MPCRPPPPPPGGGVSRETAADCAGRRSRLSALAARSWRPGGGTGSSGHPRPTSCSSAELETGGVRAMAVRSPGPCCETGDQTGDQTGERSAADQASGQPSPLRTSRALPSPRALLSPPSPRMVVASFSAPIDAPADGRELTAVGSLGTRLAAADCAPIRVCIADRAVSAASANPVNACRDPGRSDPGSSGRSLSCPAIVGLALSWLAPDSAARSDSGRTDHPCLSGAEAPAPEVTTLVPDATTPVPAARRALPEAGTDAGADVRAAPLAATRPGARTSSPAANAMPSTPSNAPAATPAASRTTPAVDCLGQPTADSGPPPLPTGLATRPGSGHPRPRPVVVIGTSPSPP